MNNIVRTSLIVLILAAVLVAYDGFYVLEEGRQAVITQFGKPVGKSETEAGLKFKTPIIQKVTFFDKRIQIWDGDPNQIPTSDKTFIYLDVTARWRIKDALAFLQSVNNITRAQSLLDDILDGTMRDLVNKNNLVEIIRSSDWSADTMSDDGSGAKYETIKNGRDKIAAMVHAAASKVTPRYGIELVDVMFKRVNYIDTVQAKVYDRMISERKRIAAEKRSQGEGQKAEIMGKVDRELKTITSTAEREAVEIKGKADATAARIYADAYNKDPEFYSFVMSMESYRTAVGANTRLLMPLDSEFYQYLQKTR